MKKFVTALAALLAAVAISVGFAACGDGDKKSAESYNEVTEEQWKSALSLFGGDPEKINTDNLNLTVNNYVSEYEDESIIKFDYANKTYHWYFRDDTEDELSNEYCWVEGETLYHYNEETHEGVTIKGKWVESCTYLEYVVEYLADSMCGMIITDIINKYSELEYSASSGCYVYQYNDWDVDEDDAGNIIHINATFEIYFSGEKIVKVVQIVTGGGRDNTYIETYTYGSTTVTIPDAVKNYNGN